MSLIQEALNRRSSELGRPALQLSLNTPPAPPPLPPPPAEPPPKPGHHKGQLALLIVLLLALLGYCGWWFFLRAPEPATAAKAQVKPAPPLTPVAPTGQPAKAISATPPVNPIAQAKAVLETTLTPDRMELVMGKTNTPAAAPAAPLPPPAITTAPPKVVVAAPVVAAPVPKAEPARPAWPKLNITGIMGRSGGESVAFINGQLLKAGDTIAGARILAVTESSVQLVFQGETNSIRVGKSGE